MAEGAPSKNLRDFLVVVLAGLAVLVAGFVGYRLGDEPRPSTSSAEAGFARDMSVHHAQAVRMALTMRDRVTDPTLRVLAVDIITGQQNQIGQMAAWLRAWELTPTDSSQAPMAWAPAGAHGGHEPSAGRSRMPGMATQADLDRLERLSGRAEEVFFLELMIEHHRGGVDMARAALEVVEVDYVRELASSIATAQDAEITYMRELLKARGGGTS